jgi:hypothetical protein
MANSNILPILLDDWKGNNGGTSMTDPLPSSDVISLSVKLSKPEIKKIIELKLKLEKYTEAPQ